MSSSIVFTISEGRMEVLFVPIRHKLAVALNNWHPSDSSAYNVLQPWAKVGVVWYVGVCVVK